MRREQAFLQAVVESPDDDAPRLIYADWLDEHGDESRAEFIRLQCALETLPPDAPERPDYEQREQELLNRFAWTWAESLQPQDNEWVYRRGFVERVEMNLQTSRDSILSVLEKAPIRHIRDTSLFCDGAGLVEALPHLDRLTGLELWGLYSLSTPHLQSLLESSHLQNLRTLILHHDRNGRNAAEGVLLAGLQSPYRANLEELAIGVDGVWRGPSRKVLRAIAASPYLRNLRKLNLSNAGDAGNRPEMDLETVRALGESPNLAGLEELDLGSASFSQAVWDEVLRWPWLTQLKWLRLHYARQIRPGTTITVAELQDVPAYRTAFESRVPKVDWETEAISPWEEDTCWRGFSWTGLSQQHLFSMWPYVQSRDYEGLESAIRKDCCRFESTEAAAGIDCLPYAAYEHELSNGLRRAMAAVVELTGAGAIYLRVQADSHWSSEFLVARDAPREPFSVHDASPYVRSLAVFRGPTFPEAARLHELYALRGPLDPGGASHYLLARLIAAFGRCVSQTDALVPVYFSCRHAVFRM
ncbi:MAG TPA: TIGR02996 domain-containing protein [Pirellulales bacterium]